MRNNEPKVALVTAGARRLGQAACLKLAELGYDIALHFNSSEKEALNTASLIKESGRNCELFPLDLYQTAKVEKLISSVLEKMGNLSLLVNNASIWVPSSFQESAADELFNNFQIHVAAPYLLSRDFSKHCSQGQIINVLDAAIVKDSTKFFPYLLTKKSLHDLTMMMAVELAPGFRVNAIAPNGLLPAEGLGASQSTNKLDQNLLQRSGTVKDFTDALEYLVKSHHLTGQCLFVSAGDQLQLDGSEANSLQRESKIEAEAQKLKSYLQKHDTKNLTK